MQKSASLSFQSQKESCSLLDKHKSSDVGLYSLAMWFLEFHYTAQRSLEPGKAFLAPFMTTIPYGKFTEKVTSQAFPLWIFLPMSQWSQICVPSPTEICRRARTTGADATT